MSDFQAVLDAFLTLTGAARVTGLSSQTLRMYADSGRVRAVRDAAGRRLLLRDDVERLAAERGRR